jgi:cob(I)alamin adenosyltransferase
MIDGFTKKYRAAIANGNRDIRISIDEATDIISAFALLNTSNTDMARILKSIHFELQDIKENIASPNDTSLDGGKF